MKNILQPTPYTKPNIIFFMVSKMRIEQIQGLKTKKKHNFKDLQWWDYTILKVNLDLHLTLPKDTF